MRDNVIPLQVIGAGPARGKPGFQEGIHGFRTYPQAIVPQLPERVIANLPGKAGA